MKKVLSILLCIIMLAPFAHAQYGNHTKIKVNKTYIKSLRAFRAFVNTWEYKSELVQDFFTFFEQRVKEDPNVDYFLLDSLLNLSNFPVFLSKESLNLDNDNQDEVVIVIGERLSPCKLLTVVDNIGGEYYIVYYKVICNENDEPAIELYKGEQGNTTFSVTTDFRPGNSGIAKRGKEFYKLVNGRVYPALEIRTLVYNSDPLDFAGGTQGAIEKSNNNEIQVVYDYGYSTMHTSDTGEDEIFVLRGNTTVKYVWSNEEMRFTPILTRGMSDEFLYIITNLPEEDYCIEEACEVLNDDMKAYLNDPGLTNLEKQGIRTFLDKHCK